MTKKEFDAVPKKVFVGHAGNDAGGGYVESTLCGVGDTLEAVIAHNGMKMEQFKLFERENEDGSCYQKLWVEINVHNYTVFQPMVIEEVPVITKHLSEANDSGRAELSGNICDLYRDRLYILKSTFDRRITSLLDKCEDTPIGYVIRTIKRGVDETVSRISNIWGSDDMFVVTLQQQIYSIAIMKLDTTVKVDEFGTISVVGSTNARCDFDMILRFTGVDTETKSDIVKSLLHKFEDEVKDHGLTCKIYP